MRVGGISTAVVRHGVRRLHRDRRAADVDPVAVVVTEVGDAAWSASVVLSSCRSACSPSFPGVISAAAYLP
jgi:hypothetical protein